MLTYLEQLIDWLSYYPMILTLMVGLIAFLESLVIVGIFVPGVVILFALAGASSAAEIPFVWIYLSAVSGAFMGDGLSYYLGYHHQDWLLKFKTFQKNPHWIPKAEKFFQKYGIYAIIIGRFVGAVRPIIPMVAGLLKFKPRTFIIIDLLSAWVWGLFYLLPGYLTGSQL